MAKLKVKIGGYTLIQVDQQGTGDSAWFTVRSGRNFVQVAAKHEEISGLWMALGEYLIEVDKTRPVQL